MGKVKLIATKMSRVKEPEIVDGKKRFITNVTLRKSQAHVKPKIFFSIASPKRIKDLKEINDRFDFEFIITFK